jgi:hypothetical protein
VEHIKEVHLLGRLLALPTNIRLRLERLARDKHSRLLRTFVSYGCKKFFNIGPWFLLNATQSFSKEITGI